MAAAETAPATHALHRAVEQGDIDDIKALLDAGANIEDRNSMFDTPLQVAVFCGYTDIVTFLLDRGADPDARDRYGSTILDNTAVHAMLLLREMDQVAHHKKNPEDFFIDPICQYEIDIADAINIMAILKLAVWKKQQQRIRTMTCTAAVA